MDLATCTKVQGKLKGRNLTEMSEGGGRLLQLRGGARLRTLFSIETIEYRRMKRWRAAAWMQELVRSARCGDAGFEP